ncbi:hypothetical protein [Liquorilactobacillus hordei]|uniref:hypothetical protein n=1 Tax=Liquorilactobacillus hordei TaxID=468911 RepID=UPI0039ECD809
MKNESSSSGLGVMSLIQLVLIMAKVFNFWKVSWLIVLIPLWIEVFFILVVLIVYIVAFIISKKER